MKEPTKIESGQFLILVCFYTIGSAILFVPGALSFYAKQDSWIAGLLGTLVSLIIILLFVAIGKRYPNLTIVEYSEVILGKWIGKFVALLYLTLPFIVVGIDLRDISDFLTTEMIPETPIQAIFIPFLLITVMGARYGVEVIGRLGEVIFFAVMLLFAIMIISIYPEIEWIQFQPVFEKGFKPIGAAVTSFLGFPVLETAVLLMIYPYVKNKKNAKKAFYVGTFFGGLLLTLTTAICIGVLGSFGTVAATYPSYALAKKINVANFFQRVEAIMAAIWFFTIYFKVVLTFFALVLGLAQMMKLKDYRPITLPIAMIILLLALEIFPNFPHLINVTQLRWTPYAFIIGACIPALLLLVDVLRKRFSSTEE